jgi:hypothetical protein
MNSTAASAKNAWPLLFFPPEEVSFPPSQDLRKCLQGSELPEDIKQLAASHFGNVKLVPLEVHVRADRIVNMTPGQKVDATKLSLDLVGAMLRCARLMPNLSAK